MDTNEHESQIKAESGKAETFLTAKHANHAKSKDKS
jgi:hypothetical protein